MIHLFPVVYVASFTRVDKWTVISTCELCGCGERPFHRNHTSTEVSYPRDICLVSYPRDIFLVSSPRDLLLVCGGTEFNTPPRSAPHHHSTHSQRIASRYSPRCAVSQNSGVPVPIPPHWTVVCVPTHSLSPNATESRFYSLAHPARCFADTGRSWSALSPCVKS